MNLDCKTVMDTMVVSVEEPRIDASAAISFKDKMRELAQGGPRRLVLDMTKVEFVDSSGLGAIIATMKLFNGGRQMDLAGLTPVVARVFKLTHMDRIFTIYPTVEDAMTPTAQDQ